MGDVRSDDVIAALAADAAQSRLEANRELAAINKQAGLLAVFSTAS